MRWVARGGLVVVLALAAPSSARADDGCLTPGPLPAARAPAPLRFGITPQTAGSAGAVQGSTAPVNEGKALGALQALRVPGRPLVLRLNRMFWSDQDAGIARYAALVDRYAAAGFQTELQVRYHPPSGQAGDLDAWADYVRRAVRALAARPSVVALSITNEANLPSSPNTSDGTYAGVIDAIVRGVDAARAQAAAMGRRDLALGFTFAYRASPAGDVSFWRQLGAKATPAFRRGLDYVGLQLYPGLFWPPPGLSKGPGPDTVDALDLLRTCWMPLAGLGASVPIWVTENGYATRGRLGQDQQASALADTLGAVARVSGTLGVTDYRYFNLRDNASQGPDLFDAVGLLFDDYRPKQAFATLREAIGRYGVAAGAPAAPPQRMRPRPRPRLRVTVRPRRVPRGRRVTLVVRVRAHGAPAARVHVRIGHWRGMTGHRGRARLRVRLVGRPGRRTIVARRSRARSARAHLRVTRRHRR